MTVILQIGKTVLIIEKLNVVWSLSTAPWPKRLTRKWKAKQYVKKGRR